MRIRIRVRFNKEDKMESYLDCEHHKMSDDGMWDICLKKKFKTEYDSYDTFLRKCEECKNECPRMKQAKRRGKTK